MRCAECQKELLGDDRGAYLKFWDRDGQDMVCIFCAAERAVKKLPASRSVQIDGELLALLRAQYGEENIKIVEKSIENRRRMK